MSERPDDLRDDVLGPHLDSALGATPEGLTLRLERLAATGLEPVRRRSRPTPLWLELAPWLASAGLALALVAGAITPFVALLERPARSPGTQITLEALLLPAALLLGMEALRGAPTVRRWLR